MRRQRCEKHGQLYSGNCPCCHNEALQQRIAELEKQIADVWGDKERVKIGYPANRVFEPLLFKLGLKTTENYCVKPDKYIESGPHMEARTYIMPRKLAEALVGVWAAVSEQLDDIARGSATRVAQVVGESIETAFGCVVRAKFREAVESVTEEAAGGRSEFVKALQKGLGDAERRAANTEEGQ